MSFFANLGYQFPLPEAVNPSGSFLLASAMPMHQLQRRDLNSKYPHLKNRLFDPQLYFSSLDPNSSPKHCSYLASYPWFGTAGMEEYESGRQKQADWRKNTRQKISKLWTRNLPEKEADIWNCVKSAIQFQLDLDCSAIILPSPLTADPSASYDSELQWLDLGIDCVKRQDNINRPVLATIAVSDYCLRNSDPDSNQLLDVIIDNLSAREINGVYLVLEQSLESNETKQCGDSRSLWSMLHLSHIFSRDSELLVFVNFLGQFGLVCRAAGAALWSTGWYKSLQRVRMADKLGGGRSYPYFWSETAAVDIHLEEELDSFIEKGLLDKIGTQTQASEGLIKALKSGVKVKDVPAWRYALSNIGSASEHFFLACVQMENRIENMNEKDMINFVSSWLDGAVILSDELRSLIGQDIKTKTNHVRAWKSAFDSYRRVHNV